MNPDYEPSTEEIADISHALGRQEQARIEGWKTLAEFVATARAWLGGQSHEYARFIESELAELDARRKDD